MGVAPAAGASRLWKDQGHKKGSLCRWPGEGSLVRLRQKIEGTKRFIRRTEALPQMVSKVKLVVCNSSGQSLPGGRSGGQWEAESDWVGS